MRTTQLHITLQELNNWNSINGHPTSDRYKDVENFIYTSEMAPPKQLISKIRPLVVDEAVDPESIVMWVKDESTDELYRFNPRLADIFKLVFESVDVDKSVLEGIF